MHITVIPDGKTVSRQAVSRSQCRRNPSRNRRSRGVGLVSVSRHSLNGFVRAEATGYNMEVCKRENNAISAPFGHIVTTEVRLTLVVEGGYGILVPASFHYSAHELSVTADFTRVNPRSNGSRARPVPSGFDQAGRPGRCDVLA